MTLYELNVCPQMVLKYIRVSQFLTRCFSELFGSQIQGTSSDKPISKRDTRIKLIDHETSTIPLEEATVQYKKQEYVTGYILP